MKILIIHNYYQNPGGEEIVVKREKELLEKNGHQVILYTKSNNELKKIKNWPRILKNLKFNKKVYSDLRKLIKKEKPNLAHIHNTFFIISPSAYLACKHENLPIVQTLHNFRFLCPNATLSNKKGICESCIKQKNFKPALKNKCYHNSLIYTSLIIKILKFLKKQVLDKKLINQFIVLSNFQKNIFIKAGFDKNKLNLKPNFVENLSPNYKKQNYAVYLGRIDKGKGLRNLIKIWQKINFPLKIIGTGELFEKLKKQNKNKNIKFLGYIENKKAIEILKKANFSILPSAWYEACPNLIIESYASATPIIGSNIGSIAEYIKNNKTGILINLKNENQTIKTINSIIADKKSLRKFSKNARKQYEKLFIPEKNYKTLIKIYKSAKNEN